MDCKEISQMANRINLPKEIITRANYLFKQIQDNKLLQGHSNDSKASACLYVACRQEGVPRTLKEISLVSKASRKDIARSFNLILKALDTNVGLTTTTDFVSRCCNNLDLTDTIQCAATHIAKKAVDMDIVSGRSPVSVAAAAIFMASQASDVKRTQKEISVIAGVTELTIRQSYKEMLPYATKLFPSTYKFSTPIEKLPAL